MAVSDSVLSNLTTIYVALIACIKVYGLIICGRNFGSGFVLVVSTMLVVLILTAALTWDVSRKATDAFSRDYGHDADRQYHEHDRNKKMHEVCKGGICWHGVAVQSPASQVRFRLPQHIPYATS